MKKEIGLTKSKMSLVRRSNRNPSKKKSEQPAADQHDHDDDEPTSSEENASSAVGDPEASNAASECDEVDDEEEEDAAKKPSSSSRRLRQELDALHLEMEIAQYGTTKTGQKRRKVPRQQLKSRTRKRKLLEQQDDQMLAEETDLAPKKLRGSKAAEKDEVLQGSLVFGAQQDRDAAAESDVDSDREAGSEEEAVEEKDEEEEFSEAGDDDEEDGAADQLDDLDDDEGEEEESDKEAARQGSAKRKKRKKGRSLSMPRASKKRLFRMRNFTSQRMARRHGEALGAHARGQPKLAIQMLRQVAKDAPSAPQVYSSLGMVYEDMLKDAQRAEKGDEEDSLSEQLELAKKAYGSYHVAAILCKKDYTLWVRAADVAKEIADLHTSMMLLPDISDNVRESNRSEKQRWLTEAKNDYQTADNLHPPGIDVPAKLAELLVELGQLSEALTLLTDLKNRSVSTGGSVSIFESSYRAWLLYSDLMLRIGYECNKWNSGDQSNCNYMFRRWLRKFSISFDWQERRLQALAKALEAAAGSKSCRLLMDWIMRRVHAKDSEDGNESLSSSGNDQQKADYPGGCNSVTTSLTESEFQQEKEMLLEKNRAELTAFDKTSAEMALNDLSAVGARDAAREALVLKHKAAVLDIVGTHHEKSGGRLKVSEPEPVHLVDKVRSYLPISASCRTVCRIAGELCRHMIEMRLHTGGRLVGEAVSLYLRERASLLEKRLEMRQEFQASQVKPTSVFALHHETYDSGESSSETEDFPLSDDDDLINQESSEIRDSLRAGVLPPELRVMYGLCLAGEGGKRFLAMKCIEAAEDLELEPLEWLREKRLDTSVVVDSAWLDFQADMTERLRRTSAYAMIAGFLRDGRLQMDDGNLSTRFSEHVEKLIDNRIIDEALNGKATHSFAQQRREYVMDVLLTSARYQTLLVERMVKASDKDCGEKGRDMIVDLFDSLARYLSLSWNITTDGSIPSSCTEILSLMGSALEMLSSCKACGDEVFLQKLVGKIAVPVALFCGIPALNLHADDQDFFKEFAAMPIQDSWLTGDLKPLAQRAFNCLVATNVSHFSGWENSEFSMALLRDTDLPYFFGITQSDGLIAGIIDSSQEEVLTTLWTLVQNILPDKLTFDFSLEASKLKSTEAYRERRQKHQNTLANQSISLFAEDSCITILLCFSRFCLQLAQLRQDKKARLVHVSMAILLPITEFFLNQTIWTSRLGQSAMSHPGLSEGRPLFAGQENEAVGRTPVPRPSRRRRAPASNLRRELHEWFSGENEKVPLSNVIQIPPATLLADWNSPSFSRQRNHADDTAMKELDESVRRLRLCYSEQAAEKASLSVAIRLVELAETPSCQNPFTCLQQAVLFASRGAKGGSSDDIFKKPLPKKEDCGAFEALGILGRADCLQAVYFFSEAAFLISYVASVCALHRDPSRSDLEWNSQWMSLALLTYNQSVLLRASANNIVKEHGRKEDTSGTWEPRVLTELKRARSDGLSRFGNSSIAQVKAQREESETNGGSASHDADPMDEGLTKEEISIDVPVIEDNEDPQVDMVAV